MRFPASMDSVICVALVMTLLDDVIDLSHHFRRLGGLLGCELQVGISSDSSNEIGSIPASSGLGYSLALKED